MAIVEQRCLIRARQAAAFQAAQDYALRRHWDPFAARLERETCADGRRIVQVTAWHGARMQVEYVAWLPPERAAIRMLAGTRLLAAFAGSWVFLPRADGMLEVRFRYQIKAARPWRWLEPWMLAYFNWETRRRLAALKRYLEHPAALP